MKSIIVAAGIAVAAIGCAQQNSPFGLPTNAGVRLGFLLPIDSSFRDQGNTLLGLGLDLPVTFSFTKEAEGLISIDYMASTISGGHGTALPILFNERFYNKVAPGLPRTYFFAGAGVAFVDVTASNLVLAARIGAGSEFNTNLYGEVAFLYTDASAGAHATNLGFYIGYRF